MNSETPPDPKDSSELIYSLKIPADKKAERRVFSAKRRYLWIGLGILALLLVFLVPRFFKEPQVNVVRAEVVQEGLPEILLTAGGYIVADSTILVSSQINGQVKKVLVEEGDQVEQGQLLAEIQDDDYRAKYAYAAADLKLANATLARKAKLFQAGVISRAEYDEAVRVQGVQQANSDSAKYFYENTKVRAPIRGTIIKKEKEPGEFLLPGITSEGVPGSAVIKIADLRLMNVELDILESELGKLKLEQPAVVFPDALPTRSYPAKLFYIAPQADRQKSIIQVKVRIEKPDEFLKPEMGARVYFLNRAATGPVTRRIVVPEQAVRQGSRGSVVFVVEKNALVEKSVSIASKRDGKIFLGSGLQGDETVVSDPKKRFKTGMKVLIKTTTPTG